MSARVPANRVEFSRETAASTRFRSRVAFPFQRTEGLSDIVASISEERPTTERRAVAGASCHD